MLPKRALLTLNELWTKQRRPQEGKETPPHFQLGGCCDYSVAWTLKCCRQTPPFCGPNWLTDRETQLSEDTSWALWEWWAGSVWNWTAAPLPVALPHHHDPPFTLATQSLLHMLTGHMLFLLLPWSTADRQEATAAKLQQWGNSKPWLRLGLSRAECFRTGVNCIANLTAQAPFPHSSK